MTTKKIKVFDNGDILIGNFRCSKWTFKGHYNDGNIQFQDYLLTLHELDKKGKLKIL